MSDQGLEELSDDEVMYLEQGERDQLSAIWHEWRRNPGGRTRGRMIEMLVRLEEIYEPTPNEDGVLGLTLFLGLMDAIDHLRDDCTCHP